MKGDGRCFWLVAPVLLVGGVGALVARLGLRLWIGDARDAHAVPPHAKGLPS
eukprot:CAMPEP_0119476588 /NCGR_PEP_ID=MMETSP1344-20130328/7047_1 /TAXON_ID=236787 /ORGANISM="Florenciella parvula, Strain CCMP2471" /LENGTH=51 /DNA_ID=CAMNT_0007510377 /DNA_START=225 /DNA_END=380 /DNA_ORIENTATION=-